MMEAGQEFVLLFINEKLRVRKVGTWLVWRLVVTMKWNLVTSTALKDHTLRNTDVTI